MPKRTPPTWILSLLLAAILLPGCAGMTLHSQSQTVNSKAAQHLIQQVNRLRKAKGLQTLQVDPQLSAIALAYSREQALAGAISHSDSSGKWLEHRLNKAGYANWRIAGENLALNNATNPVPQAIRGWQISASHRDNLYTRGYNRTGAAVVSTEKDGKPLNYITQIYTQQR